MRESPTSEQHWRAKTPASGTGALMPVEDEDLDRLLLASNPRFAAVLEEARAQRRAGLGLTSEELHRELGLVGP